METADVDVRDEQIITHPTADKTTRGYHGEAHVMVTVKIGDKFYFAEKYISLSFQPSANQEPE